MKARYLSIFSYVGTNFRSSEKLWLKGDSNYPDPLSIQGLIELALLKFKPLNYPRITLSSRTDGGVHGLRNTCHFDLERFGDKIYCPNGITYQLNKTFTRNATSIHVHNTYRVPDDFSARFKAKSRTYLFRLAVLKPEVVLPEHTTLSTYIPIEEWKRCYFIKNLHFDINKFIEGSKYFVGYHDFTTFKKFDKAHAHKQNRREILSIDVRPGTPLYVIKRDIVDLFNYWDIEIKGRAFVHNQIRRMIGCLIGVAIGKLPPEEIKVMLQVPSKHNWSPTLQVAPPDGLYLVDVEYDPRDFIYEGGAANDELNDGDSDVDE